ncbi:hypothetical protein PGB90_007119 [Kerria lacca]
MGRATSFCCGCSVKAGTSLLLLIHFILFGFIFLKSIDYVSNNSTCLIIEIILLLVVILGFIGIGQNKPLLLIPYFLLTIIETIFTIVISALLIFAEVYVFEHMFDYELFNMFNVVGTIKNQFNNVIIVLVLLEIFIIILQYHCARVVYSCYKEIEDFNLLKTNVINYNEYVNPLKQSNVLMNPYDNPSKV